MGRRVGRRVGLRSHAPPPRGRACGMAQKRKTPGCRSCCMYLRHDGTWPSAFSTMWFRQATAAAACAGCLKSASRVAYLPHISCGHHMRGAGSSLMSSCVHRGRAQGGWGEGGGGSGASTRTGGQRARARKLGPHQVVADNVGLLQEQAHLVGKVGRGGDVGALAARGGKELQGQQQQARRAGGGERCERTGGATPAHPDLREADAHQPRHVVAVKVVLLDALDLCNARAWWCGGGGAAGVCGRCNCVRTPPPTPPPRLASDCRTSRGTKSAMPLPMRSQTSTITSWYDLSSPRNTSTTSG